MIYGIGTDICDVRRIRASHWSATASALPQNPERRRAGDLEGAQRALARAGRALPGHALFSAKEAFSKAIGWACACP
jgi:phosphopantetheinyl transferase (holo-ACP synthase)